MRFPSPSASLAAPATASLAAILLVSLAVPLAAVLPAQQLRELESGHVPHARLEPNDIVSGDLDGDGDLDLVLAQNPRLTLFDGRERLWLNDGHGRFRDASSQLPSASDFTHGLALGDVDGDGDLDLFTFGNTTQLWINDGRANFTDQSAALLPPEGRRSGMFGLLADFDRDGDLDLVHMAVHTDAYLVNGGQGAFTLGAALPFGRSSSGLRNPPFQPTAGAVGDTNGDGNLDLLIAGGGDFVQFAGDGRGGFGVLAHGIARLGAVAQDLALADVDNDGDLDAAVAIWGNPFLQPVRTMLLANNGSGTFVDVTNTAMPNAYNSHAVAFADLDGDGNKDLIVGRDVAPVVLLGDGQGSFAPAPPALQPSASESNVCFAAADLNGDRRPDLALASTRIGPGPTYWAYVEFYANDGGTALALLNPPRLPRFPALTTHVHLVDVDRDGDLDLWRASTGDAVLLVNDGAGWFTPATSAQLPAATLAGVSAVAVADHDADGDQDAFVALADGQRFLADNDGRGNFTIRALPFASVYVGDALWLDADGDGDLDLMQGVWGVPELWLNDGRGNLTPSPHAMPPMSYVHTLAAGDVDGDGDLDLLLGGAYPFRSTAHLWRNDGTGRFIDATAGALVMPDIVREIRLHDHDGDGDLDALFATQTALQLHVNDGTGRFTDVTAALLPPVPGTSGVTLADLDGDRVPELVVPRWDGTVVLRRQGNGYVVASGLMPADPFGSRCAAGDLDRDGDIDIVLGRGPIGGVPTPDSVLLNLDRHVHAPFVPQPGRPFELRLHRVSVASGNGAPAALPCLALGVLAPRLSLPPFGELGLDPATLLCLPPVSIPATSGELVLQLTIPNLPALAGLPLATQALVAPAASMTTWRFTNVTQQVVLR